MLDLALQSDICSSIRPKIGKVFGDPILENLKLKHLDTCRKKLIEISILEADSDLLSLKSGYKEILTNSQKDLTKKQFLTISKLAKSTESKILKQQKKKHDNKIINLNNGTDHLMSLNIEFYTREKVVKHRDTVLQKSRLRNQRRRMKSRVERNRNLAAKSNP